MFWTKEVLNAINKDTTHLVNDSKTPSGEPHVGSLRGVLIHDAIFKVLRDSGVNVRYTFGSDDYDPVDEIPKGQDAHFEQYLGMPLCNVPPPPGSAATDMADHFISGFFRIFDDLGVEAEKYRMRDVYRSGSFNNAIEEILNHSEKVRTIYKKVSGSEKSTQWYPFQSICENCGRIGTTEVIDFDGKEVTYICRPDMVKWATGCGYKGKRSPFDGGGKLPWKLEWVAKWKTWGITIEGAGMDHSTKGGSRDVSGHILRSLFNQAVPFNVPYGFFLVDGAKMSSSKGIGVSAREMAAFLPAEILRYMMLATPPKRAINFSPKENYIVKLFNDFDAARAGAFSGDPSKEMQRDVYEISELNKSENYQIPGFSLVKTLLQMPHIDLFQEAAAINGRPLTNLETSRLETRIESARFWLENFAEEDDKFTIQEQLPSKIYEQLSLENLGFLAQFAEDLEKITWSEANIQQQIFDSSRLTPTVAKLSFKALYNVFLDRDTGPIVGRLLFYLGKEKVIRTLKELDFDVEAYWEACSISETELTEFVRSEGDKVTAINHSIRKGVRINTLEVIVETGDGHRTLRRVLLDNASIESSAQRIMKNIAIG